MNSFGVCTRQVGRMAVVVALLFAVLLPALIPALVAAAQVTERSIMLSSSSKAATGVTYTVNFTAPTAAGAFVLDFCSNSPMIGQPCTAPGGFSVSTATSSTSGFTDVSAFDDNTLMVTGTIASNDAVSVALAGITNPSASGPLYARIVTYDTQAHASEYTSESIGSDTVVADEGGLAVAITDTVGVSGSVLESMTFCVSGTEITATCGSTTTPVLRLGEPVGGTSTLALDSAHVSTSDMYAQISTNALNGAIVSLKSGVTCGGLKRLEATTTCDIVAALAGGVTEGQAKFGVKTSAATSTAGVSDALGTFQPASGSMYNDTSFNLNYVSNGTSGITSSYGDPFLDTANAPVNNKNMKLTFGASVSNSTPAGTYSADLSMIATGKF